MTESSAPDVVDGVQVEARQVAQVADQRPGRTGRTMMISTVDEVLLATGEVVFQCNHPNRGDCRQTYDNYRSVLAHQKVHAARAEGRRLAKQLAEVSAAKAAAEVELAQRKQRRSDGSRRGAETRRQRQTEQPQSTPTGDVDQRVLLTDEIQTRIKKIRSQVESIERELSNVIDGLDDLTAVAGLVTNLPGADATTLEKARRYDILTTPITNPIK